MKRTILIVLFFATSFAWAAKKIRYPTVLESQGTVSLVEPLINVENRKPIHSEKTKPLKKGNSLKDKAIIRTEPKSELRLALNEKATLILEADTVVELPAITWNDGGVSDIIIRRGKIRYICQTECDRKVMTPIFESVLPVGDYLISYDPNIPSVELSVIAGETVFRGLENENSVILKRGEKASFQGVLENNEPAFDILLKGRKVAKGQMSEVQKIPEEKLAQLKNKEERRLKALRAPPKTKRKPTQICDKPWGELNQCAWVCENNKRSSKDCKVDKGAVCVRMRCNANGEWADRMELSPSQSRCQAKPLVGICDY